MTASLRVLRSWCWTLTGADLPDVVLDEDRIRSATGVVGDNLDPRPYLQIVGAPRVAEGGTLEFVVRVGVEGGAVVGDIAEEFTVRVSTVAAPVDGCCTWATPGQDYTPVDPADSMLTFSPGGPLNVPVQVVTLDDVDSPVGEVTEHVRLILSDRSAGAPQLHSERWKADGEILDDEATVSSIVDVTPVDAAEGDPVVFRVALDKAPAADVTLGYTLGPDARRGAHRATPAAGGSCTDGGDYLGAAGQVTIAALSLEATFEVRTCEDVLVERDETFWVGLSRDGGEVVVPAGTGAHGTIRNDDIPVISVSPATAEGTEGDRLAFTVSLTVDGQPAQLTEDVTVAYEIGGNGSDPATAPGEPDADYGVTLDTATLSGSTLQGTLTFTVSTPGTPPVTEHIFEVELLADHLLEDPETLQLKLSDGDPADSWMLDDASATGTIRDNAPPVLSVEGFTGSEGTTQSFTVTLNGARGGETVTVDYAISGGTGADGATAPGSLDPDFEPVPASGPLIGTVTLEPGTTCHTSCTIDVSLLHDTVIEGPEELRLTLANPSGAVLSGSDPNNDIAEIHGVGIIENVDPPVLSVAGFTGPEGTTQSFTVTLDDARGGETVTVEYAISGDSGTDPATAIDDFRAPPPDPLDLSGTLTFTAGGAAEIEVPVELVGDYVPDENPETLRLTLTNPSGAALFGSDRNNSIDQIHATGTIENVDPPRLSVTGFTGPEDSTQSFTVELDIPPRLGDTVTVAYRIEEASPRSAEQGVDYEAAVGYPFTGERLTFGPGVTSQTVPVRLLPDSYNEADETFRIVLSNPDKAHLDVDTATGTITNVDPPELTVNDPGTLEGEVMTFTVTLIRGRAGEDVDVYYKVEDQSAKECKEPLPSPTRSRDCDPPDGDYAPVTPGTLRLSDTSPTATVAVQTLTDKIAENAETLHLVLTGRSPTHIAMDDPIGVGTITNVNPAVVRINNPKAEEGEDLAFEIFLVDDEDQPAPIINAVTVEYYTADRTAIAGDDYTAVADPLTPGSHTFLPGGATTHRVNVTTKTDTEDEDDETIALVLRVDPDSDAAVLGDTEGTGTISDRPPPRICIEDAPAVRESEDAVFIVSLRDHNDSIRQGSCRGDLTVTSETVTVEYATGDRTAHAGLDYEQKSGMVTFDSGESTQSITVLTSTDDIWEPVEEFRVDLHTPVNAILDKAVGTGTIRADCISLTDPEIPTWTLYEQTIDEGSLGSIWASLDRPLCFPWSYEWMFVEGTATRADFPSTHNRYFVDETTYTQNARISADDRFSVYPFFTEDDDLDEEDEEELTVRVRWVRDPLDRYNGAPDMPDRFFVDNPWIEVRYTIRDNDPLPNVSIADAAAIAGESMTFEVSLDAPSGRNVTVDYYTVDVTAEGNSVDYSSVPEGTPGTVTIPAGWLSDTFTVQTESNTLGEHDETFHVVLTGASNANIDDGVGIGTILAQAGPSLSIADASASEGETMSFSVTLSAAAPHDVTVDYVTIERADAVNPATEGDDYVADSGTLTFSTGETERFVYVGIETDDFDEPNETFRVELGNQTAGVSLADSAAIGTIQGNVECLDVISPGAESLPDYTGTVSGPSVSGYSGFSVREDSGDITLTLSFEMPFCHGYPIVYDVAGGAAQQNVDFVFRAYGRVQMVPLDPDVDIVIPIIDDDLAEGDEDVRLRIRGNTLGAIVKRFEEIYVGFDIVDDDVARIELPADGDTTTQESGYLSFVVRLDRPTVETVTFDYVTRDGSAPVATEDVDYEPTRGSAEILPGGLSVSIPVRTIEDALYEHDENVELVISNLTGADPDPDGDSAVGRIVDDDEPPAVRVSNPIADEGGVLVFEVTLDAPAGRDASVSYTTRDGTAAAGVDYGFTAGSLVFAAGEVAKTVSVQALTDGESEGEEIFFLDLSGTDLRYDKGTGTGTIRDRSVRRVSVSDAVADEGEALEFVVGVDGPPASRDITVQYSTVAGTAEAGVDYSDAVESVPGTVRILAGTSSAVALVETEPDTLDEDIEQLTLVLSAPSAGAELAAGEAVGTIIDDDPEPLLSIDNPEATENGDGTPVTFTVSLSSVSGRDVSVAYSTVDSSAVEGDDYVAAASPVGSPLVIPRGARSVQVPVALVDDDVEEPVERFQLVLSGPSNAGFGDGIGVATILDDDAAPQILIDDAAAVYEAAGASVSFAVRLSRAAADAVTVEFATEDATALAGDDYIHTSDTLTFAAGQTAMTVGVDLVDDDVAEETETFGLRLSNPSSNATVGDNDSAVATVLDDDALPKLSVFDAPVATEGTTATFSVELSRASALAVTVAYAAVADPFGGDAAAIPGQDFEAVTGTLTIPARTTSATVTVPLPDDALDEHTETFWLRLADPTDATVEDGTGIGTIADDDPLPQLNIADSGATEGDPIQFTVTLEPASGRTVTVPWTTAVSSTGDPASPTEDYAAASGTLTFASGTTSVNIDVATVDDEVSEPDETFQVQLGQPTDAAVDDGVAVGAIVDDDSLPRLSIAGTELLETDSPATFVVTLSSLSGQAVTVDYATHAVTATARDDYGTPDGEATGTLVISAGLHTGEISVYVADDGVPEGTETFWITLSNAVNAVIAEGSGIAVGTILDDDVARIAVGDADAYEADGTIEFPVTLSAASAHPVTVRYTTFDGSATQTDDYTAVSATLTIPAQTTTATIPVTLTDDTYTEEPESFLVRLSDPADAEIEDAEAVGVILDDDNLPVLSIEDIFGREDDGALLWSVSLSRPSDREVTVDYTTVAGDSCPPTPAFELVSGTLVFEPGSTTAAFELPLVDNSDSCAPNWRIEEARASLSNPMNAQLGVSYSASAYIHDDESRPYASFLFRSWDRVLQVGEGDGTFFFTIQLWRTSEDDITFDYRVDETATLQSYIHSAWRADYLSMPQATAASDFPALGGSVTIPAGERYATVTVPILDDGIVEETETFLIALLNNSDVDYILQALRVEIIDDDARSLAVEGIEVHESAGTAQFRVTLDGGGGQPVTVQYATADGTAIAPDDYAHTVGELTFSDGATSAFVQVPLVDDEVTEASETFELRLSNPVGADIGRGTATATIRDDNLPVITLASASEVSEDQDRNVSYLCFDLTASDAGGAPISVDYQYLAAPWLGERAAEPGADYIDWTAGGPLTRTFGGPGGETSTPICASVVNDTIPERDEMFILWLSNPVNAVLGNSLGWATILDSDRPIVSIADVGASEADDAVVFTVQLHEPGLHPARLRYTTLVRTSEGEAAARPGDDYIHTAGTLNIAAGETTATISVPIIGDNIDEELEETFLLELSEPEGLAFSKSAAVGTIIDDDPGWVIDDRSVWEDAGTVVFTVTRDHTGTSAVTVIYTVTGASAVGGASCTAGVDYITPSGTPSGSVTLLPAETQAEITVMVCDDDVAEGSESLLIELSGVTGRKLTGTGTIFDGGGG